MKKGNWENEEDNKVKKLFYLGYTAREIGEELDRSKWAVQKRIQFLKSENKLNEKEKNSLILLNRKALIVRENLPIMEQKEVNRALNHESNKYITGRSLGKQCKSAYENYSGGKRLKKETDNMVYPIDMPKYIKTIF